MNMAYPEYEYRKGLAEQLGDWLESKPKNFRLRVVILTFFILIFVHGFLLRMILGYYTNLMFYYVEGIISLLFGGPLFWFVIAYMSYKWD